MAPRRKGADVAATPVVYPSEPPKFYTVAEVARDHLKVSEGLVREMLASGQLGHQRTGRLIRISSTHLHEFAAKTATTREQ